MVSISSPTAAATFWAPKSITAALLMDFGSCVLATTLVYALILPVLLLVPKEVIATSDGEASPVGIADPSLEEHRSASCQ